MNKDSKLIYPAVAMIIVEGLNILAGIFMIIATVAGFKSSFQAQTFANEAGRYGYLVGYWSFAGIGLISILLCPLVFYGAIQMLKAQSYSFAKAAAIICLLPFSSLCFVLNMPIGIWALWVLSRPSAKASFSDGVGKISMPYRPY